MTERGDGSSSCVGASRGGDGATGAERAPGAEGAGGAGPSRSAPDPPALVSLPEAAESTGWTASFLLGRALRDPEALAVFVIPETPGWAAIPWIADAGARAPTWRDDAPPWSWLLVRGPIRLTTDVLREVLVSGLLRRFTCDAAPIRAVRSQVGYDGWSIERGVVEVDESTRTETPVLRCMRLCEDRRISREALLVDRADVAGLVADQPLEAARPDPPRAGDVVSEDRAARSLPWRRRDAVAWLRHEGLSVVADARRVVVWAAVLDRLRPSTGQAPRRREPPTSKLLGEPGRILD